MRLKPRFHGVPIASKAGRRTLPAAGLVAGAIAVGAFAPGAHAQTKVDEVIVTAQKRAQDVQEVPASISAFSGTALETRQIHSVEGVFNTIPNVTFNIAGSFTPTIAIRGIAPDGVNGTIEPSVALNIDGVYQPRIYGVFLAMHDLEDIEVLRGPQGTLYGRNATGGVINLNSRRPTSMFEASGSLSLGDYDHVGARGYVSGPVAGDKVLARLSAIYDRHSGYGKNLFTGARVDAGESYGGRLTIRLLPRDNVTVDLIASQLYDSDTNARYNLDGMSGASYDAIVAAGLGAQTTAPWRTYANFPTHKWSRQSALTGIVTWELAPHVSLKSITGGQRFKDSIYTDGDTLAADYLVADALQTSTTFSQEFDLSAKLWDRVDAVLGAYYLKDHNNGGSPADFNNGFPVFSLAPTARRDIQNQNFIDQRLESKAVFADATVNLTNRLRVLGGVRYTEDDKSAVETIGAQLQRSTNTYLPTNTCVNRRAPDLKFTSTTGKVGAQYDFAPGVMGYVQWQSGFKAGGYAAAACGVSFLPEEIKDLEAGVKSTLFDGALTLNVSLFDYDYSNLQLTRIINLAAVVDNAAKAKIRGGEIEGVARFGHGLRADFGLGLLDSKYVGYSSKRTATEPLLDLTGNQLVKAPKVTANLGVEYLTPVGEAGNVTFRAETNYSSRVYFTPFNEAIAKQDGYSIYNLLATFRPNNPRYEVQFYVKNITNKAYKTGAAFSTILNYVTGSWNEPRTFGAELTVKY